MSASDVAVVRRVYDAMDGLAGIHNPNFDRVAGECFAPEYGDRGVLVLSRSRGRSPSGLEVDVKTAEFQEMRDGRMVRTVSYPTRSEALALYGLS